MKTAYKLCTAAAVCCLLAMTQPHTAPAAVARQMNITGLIESAGYIFAGTCTGRTVAYDSGLKRDVCLVTFAVDHNIKGVAGDTFTMKLNKMLVDLRQVPVCDAGDRVLMFVYKESRLGYSSPVGLGQGRFAVFTAPDGTLQAVNGNNNAGLFRGIDTAQLNGAAAGSTGGAKIKAALQQQAGPLDYDALLSLISALSKK